MNEFLEKLMEKFPIPCMEELMEGMRNVIFLGTPEGLQIESLEEMLEKFLVKFVMEFWK